MNKIKRDLVIRFLVLYLPINSHSCKEIFVFRKQLGGKLGSSLQSDLGVNTVGDLLQFSESKLQELYGINTG